MVFKLPAIVIDLETCDTISSAMILSIGAITFDIADVTTIDTVIKNNDIFYENIDLTDQFFIGRTISKGTQEFWMSDRQKQARKSFEGNRISVTEGMKKLIAYIESKLKEHGKLMFFFRGPDFDHGIIKDLCKALGLKDPVQFNRRNDVRSYINAKVETEIGYLKDYSVPYEGARHGAMYDVISDAYQMCEARRRGFDLNP